MKCNLVKKVSVSTNKEGKETSFTNYYLVFENNVIIPVINRYYPTDSISDKNKAEQLKSYNTRNFTLFNALADLLKD